MHKHAKKTTKQDDAMKSPTASPLLFAIKEEELPEVHGSSYETHHEATDEPDDNTIIIRQLLENTRILLRKDPRPSHH
jgi:hypothetical protein